MPQKFPILLLCHDNPNLIRSKAEGCDGLHSAAITELIKWEGEVLIANCPPTIQFASDSTVIGEHGEQASDTCSWLMCRQSQTAQANY
jgi:hypothetical protein